MTNENKDSPIYLNLSQQNPIKDLLGKICIVNVSNNRNSFCAKFIKVYNENELWFESKEGQCWMVVHETVRITRPLRHQKEVS